MQLEDIPRERYYSNDYVKTGINILVTASWVTQFTHEALKPFNLTFQQYLILRILKFEPDNQSSITLLTHKMLDPQSNTTRIVDRLESKKLVQRDSDKNDKRKIIVKLTTSGKSLADKVTEDVEKAFTNAAEVLSPKEVETLNEILKKLRGNKIVT
jgi:DNA-binding MarR family transcriptional regulator